MERKDRSDVRLRAGDGERHHCITEGSNSVSQYGTCGSGTDPARLGRLTAIKATLARAAYHHQGLVALIWPSPCGRGRVQVSPRCPPTLAACWRS